MPPLGCLRKYDSAHAVSSAHRKYEQDIVRAFRAEHGALALGNASLASALSLDDIKRRSSAHKRSFLRRFKSVGRAAPVPVLSIGCAIADAVCSDSSVPEAHSYSNAMQDLSLHSHFFRGQRNGVYVEIGAMDGVGASNTLFFEQHLNWTGVLIEPSACGMCVLPKLRPHDRTVNAGACSTPSRLRAAASEFGFKGRPFCSQADSACVGADFSVPCEPMARLLAPLPSRIDLFSIDVESNVMEVLRTIPWGDVVIDVLLVEPTGKPGTHMPVQVTTFLRARGYALLPASFGADVVAVRAACLEPPLPAGFVPAGAWWGKFFPGALRAANAGMY